MSLGNLLEVLGFHCESLDGAGTGVGSLAWEGSAPVLKMLVKGTRSQTELAESREPELTLPVCKLGAEGGFPPASKRQIVIHLAHDGQAFTCRS